MGTAGWLQASINNQNLWVFKPASSSATCSTPGHSTHHNSLRNGRSHLPIELSGSFDPQEARRQELTAYLQSLRQNQSAEPSTHLTFGTDFYSLVQRLCQQRKTEYASIRGMLGTPSAQQHLLSDIACWLSQVLYGQLMDHTAFLLVNGVSLHAILSDSNLLLSESELHHTVIIAERATQSDAGDDMGDSLPSSVSVSTRSTSHWLQNQFCRHTVDEVLCRVGPHCQQAAFANPPDQCIS